MICLYRNIKFIGSFSLLVKQMPEQQYKREIEEILRLADESEDPDLVDISYDEHFSVFQYYFLKMKENLLKE